MNSEAGADGEGAETSGDADAGGYVHRPDGEPAVPDETDEGLGRRGWVLVAVVVLATLVIPGIIYLYPSVLGDRVPFLVAMLALPFVPAVLLGATAVWSMVER